MNNKLSLTKDQIDELVFNKKSEVKMKDKLKIKIWNYKNVVLYEVLEQDESLRNHCMAAKHIFKASNGWHINSLDTVSIVDCRILYIRGVKYNEDNKVDCKVCNSTQEAKQLVKEVKQAVKEFNENQREILTDKEKEYLSAVIKPFRDEVKYISKSSNEFTKEYIYITFEGDSMGFKNFEKDTMYKGMKVDKHYTLEELGL